VSTPVIAYVHGIFPRSARLIAATRDLERGRTTPDEVEARRADHTASLVELQCQAGLDVFSDGLVLWQDLFRPFTDACDGLEAGPLVRWFDTNSFYRAPVVSGEPSLTHPERIPFDPDVPAPRVATLPSPLLFSRVAHLADGGTTRRDTLLRRLTAEVLRPAADLLVAAGCSLVHLEEPWVVAHSVDEASWDALGAALDELRAGLGASVALHTSFGDAGPAMERLRALPVDALGVDLVDTDVEDLGRDWTVGLVVGCLNGRSSLVESVDATAKVATAAAERAGAPVLYLSSGTSLDLLPEPIAAEKVRVLGDAARTLREALR
jgi:5-methyltetrahydropteroyltriglutamate--homocysteine methyltransferase